MSRPGDWSCAECGYHNYASRSQCFKCKAAKPTGATVQPQAQAQAQAVQTTPVHTYTPTQSKVTMTASYDLPTKIITGEDYVVDPVDPQNCNWRGLGMEELMTICTRGKDGDWICNAEGCKHMLNYASRTECMACGGPRGATDGDDFKEIIRLFTWLKRAANRVNASPKYLGEWSCSSCSALNYAKQKTHCFKCSAPKTVESYNPGAKEAKVVVAPHYKIDTSNPDSCTWRALDRAEITNLVSHGKPGDWLCTKCCNHNYKVRDTCKQCNEAMPPNGQGQEWFNEVVQLFSWMKKPVRPFYKNHQKNRQ